MMFKDHFSGHADIYAASRPSYPTELFDYLARISPALTLAWDCATGNGQSAVALAAHFEQVLATDGSAAQIQAAEARDNILYKVATAETQSLDKESADLICVSQALHWFDTNKFFQVVDRGLKPGGILGVWSYGIHWIDEEVDPIIDRLYRETLDGYWTYERLMVEEGYRNIEFPYEQLAPPEFTMSLSWSQKQVEAYLRSWSAVQKYINTNQQDPVAEISQELTRVWGDPSQNKVISWPLTLIIRRKPG